MTWVKVCGLMREPDRDAAVDAGVDALGFIAGVTVDTPREVTLDRATALTAGAPDDVTTVLVTMPADPDEAVERARRVDPDAIQIHGLTPTEIETVVTTLEGPRETEVIAAVDAAADDATLDAYAGAADRLLVDSLDEAGGGGTGDTHDWTRTRQIAASQDVPVILAGGLTPDNVREAVGTVTPFGVDVASGVEASGGVKDHAAIRRFVANATATGGTPAGEREVADP
jgi:phosphoribosylanthranilate isomerase